MSRETQRTVTEWGNGVFGEYAKDGTAPARSLVEFGELLVALGYLASGEVVREIGEAIIRRPDNRDHEAIKSDDEVLLEMADVVIVLYRAASAFGGDLMEAVDRKMRINRARKWEVHGDGLGQHVEE